MNNILLLDEHERHDRVIYKILESQMAGHKIVLELTEEMVQEHLRERQVCQNSLMHTLFLPKAVEDFETKKRQKKYLDYVMGIR